eukprot:Gregarina_sp_Poly_1__7808@NODE_441_length_8354_cov_301_408350_g77_i1_p4_GENE_NODE_441_length_8354_cov_301_408350_g77_i1NODE_441_length_8354_cov_301_408350_g77_i1_p4_ORF_typecomplete_len398_score52_63DUF4771/PF15995_5/0_0072AAA_lid_7/PF17867_1/0_023NRN1/PF15056_6/2_8NRN1/PF15056_6/90_NODE_441_length_8354_cov_301_408350_g77_i123533546
MVRGQEARGDGDGGKRRRDGDADGDGGKRRGETEMRGRGRALAWLPSMLSRTEERRVMATFEPDPNSGGRADVSFSASASVPARKDGRSQNWSEAGDAVSEERPLRDCISLRSGSRTHIAPTELNQESTFFERNADITYGYSSRVLDQLQEETAGYRHTLAQPGLVKSSSIATPYDVQSVVLELQRSSVLNQLASSKWMRYEQFVANTQLEEVLRRQRDIWEKLTKKNSQSQEFKSSRVDRYELRDLLRPHLKRTNRRFLKKFMSQIPEEHRYWWEHLLFELLSFQVNGSVHDLSLLCVCGRQFVQSNLSSSIHLCTWKLPRERCASCNPIWRYLRNWQLDVISSKNEDLLSSFELLVARSGAAPLNGSRCSFSRRSRLPVSSPPSVSWRKHSRLPN